MEVCVPFKTQHSVNHVYLDGRVGVIVTIEKAWIHNVPLFIDQVFISFVDMSFNVFSFHISVSETI